MWTSVVRDAPEKCQELPYFNIRDIYAQRMHAFITSLSSVGIVVSDSTDASSIEDNEDVYNTASLENLPPSTGRSLCLDLVSLP